MTKLDSNNVDDFFLFGTEGGSGSSDDLVGGELDLAEEGGGFWAKVDSLSAAIERNCGSLVLVGIITAVLCLGIDKLDRDDLLRFRAVRTLKSALIEKGVEGVGDIRTLTRANVFDFELLSDPEAVFRMHSVGLVPAVGVAFPDFLRTAELTFGDMCEKEGEDAGICPMPGECEAKAMSTLRSVMYGEDAGGR